MGKTISGIKFQGRYKLNDLVGNVREVDFIDIGSEAVVIVRGIVPADIGDMSKFAEAVKTIESLKSTFAETGSLIGEFKTVIGNFIVDDGATSDEPEETSDMGTTE